LPIPAFGSTPFLPVGQQLPHRLCDNQHRAGKYQQAVHDGTRGRTHAHFVEEQAQRQEAEGASQDEDRPGRAAWVRRRVGDDAEDQEGHEGKGAEGRVTPAQPRHKDDG
jgi:hypothetical protein